MFKHGRRVAAEASLLVAVVAFALDPDAAEVAKASSVLTRYGTQHRPALVRATFLSPVIDLYHSASITVSGFNSRHADVRLLGAIDRTGLAYEWKPYPWRPLRLIGSNWHGLLPAPRLLGIYQVQLRLDDGRTPFTSPRWPRHVFADGTCLSLISDSRRRDRDFVADRRESTAGGLRQWPRAASTIATYGQPARRDRLLTACRTLIDSRRGRFCNHRPGRLRGRWRVLEATTQPYD